MDHALPLNGDIPMLPSEGASAVSPSRRARKEDTDTMPRLPSQRAIDIAYLVNKCGRITAAVVLAGPAVLFMLPWIGTNVVVPIVNSATKYVETQAEISKSLVIVSQNSVKVSAQVLEQISSTEKRLEHIAARLDASLEVQKETSAVQKETQATLKRLEGKL